MKQLLKVCISLLCVSTGLKAHIFSFDREKKEAEEVRSTQEFNQTWSSIQKNVEHGVVQVIAHKAEKDPLKPYRSNTVEAVGSGFFINKKGDIVTNYHVAEKCIALHIQMPLAFGKKMLAVEVVGVCPDRDIALLKLTKEAEKMIKLFYKEIPYLTLGNSDCVERADELLALGYPLGQESLKSTTGVVSGREHATIRDGGKVRDQYCIQISAPINPGSSGGPSLNTKGEVVGINCAGSSTAQNIGFSIPINEFKNVESDLRKYILLKKPLLGAGYCYANDDLARLLGNPAPAGCYVTRVYRYGLCQQMGVEPGDMIYKVNNHPVDEFGYVSAYGFDKCRLVDYIAQLPLGTTLEIEVYRDGEKKVLSTELVFSEEPPITWHFYDFEDIDYEIISGLLIQELSLNLIGFFADPHIRDQVGHIYDYLIRYADPEAQEKSALIVTQVFSGSHAQEARSIGIGEIITHINGQEVFTLDDLRKVLVQDKNEKYITFETRDSDLLVFDLQKVLERESYLSYALQYPITPCTQYLLEDKNLVTDMSVQRLMSIEV